ncbi:MAG: amidohydrolase [Acidimicrobiales bacterium]
MVAADLVLVSGRLLDPVTGELSPHSGLAAVEGRITLLGDDEACRTLAGPATTVIDLHGAVVTPGLVDGHIHPVFGAERAVGIDLSQCANISEIRDALTLGARDAAPGTWLRGWGLDPNSFGVQTITAAAVGPIMEHFPVLLRLFDGHAMLASPPALAAAGIDGPRRFDETAEIVCDVEGHPTGLLLEGAAMALMDAVAPRLSDRELRDLIAGFFAGMAATGLTGGHAMDANGNSLAIYRDLDEVHRLAIRLRVSPWCRPPSASADDLAALISLQGARGRLWEVAGVKLFMDGTIDNGTAWLEHPDCFGNSTRGLWPDPEAYTNAVIALHRAGVPTATHAIGDAAVRHVLDTVARAGNETHRQLRHRVEHIETIPDETVARFARLGVTASMQPLHCTEFTRADHSDNWSHRLGDERASRAWRCRDLLDAGAHVVLGSDWPIAASPPLGTMAGARHRRSSRDPSGAPHGSGQRLTPLQALQGLTTAPAWAAGEEHEAGRLAVGYRADLAVFAENPLSVTDDDLAEVPVMLTVLEGHPTYRDASL